MSNYKIGEYVIEEGNIVDDDYNNYFTLDTGVTATATRITFTSDETGQFAVKINAITNGKRYKYRFQTVACDMADGIAKVEYLNQSARTTDDDGNQLCDVGWHTVTGTQSYASVTGRIQFGVTSSANSGETWQIENISVTEIPPLPTIDTGTKYLECDTDGVIAKQSKTAYGEWEFDLLKGDDGNDIRVFFSSLESETAEDSGEGYFLRFNFNEAFSLRTNRDGLSAITEFNTANSYFDNNIWYRIKVARLQSEGIFKDIETLQTSDMVNSASFPYDTFTSKGRYGFSVTSDGSAFMAAGTADEISLVTGAKYLIEFDAKLNSGTGPTISFHTGFGASGQSDNTTLYDGRNSHILTATGTSTCVLQFWNNSSTADYEISGLTIRRIYDANTFAVFIKGGDFGNDYTLVDADTGSNPVTDSTYTTSNYFVVDLDAGDKITNISIKDGVPQ